MCCVKDLANFITAAGVWQVCLFRDVNRIARSSKVLAKIDKM